MARAFLDLQSRKLPPGQDSSESASITALQGNWTCRIQITLVLVVIFSRFWSNSIILAAFCISRHLHGAQFPRQIGFRLTFAAAELCSRCICRGKAAANERSNALKCAEMQHFQAFPALISHGKLQRLHNSAAANRPEPKICRGN